MDQSSFLSNSSKFKKRKPIFSKNQNSPVAKLQLSKSSSFQALPNKIENSTHLHNYQRVDYRQQDRIQGRKVEATVNPIRISYSQPKIVHAPVSEHIIYSAKPTPMLNRSVTPQRVIYQTPIQTTQYHPTQNLFYQTMQATPASTLRRSSHHLYQTQPISMVKVQRKALNQSKQNLQENKGSGVNLKPTVVAIERVMKEVGSNHVQKKITYLSKEQGQCQPPNVRIIPPHSEYNTSSLASNTYKTSSFTPELTPSRIITCSEDVEFSKLTQINSLLTENYNLLYNQFFNLKREIREEEVVEEQTFLQKSANQIESIFNVQTSHALSQIQQIFQRSKHQPLKKSYKNKNEIKVKNVYV